MKSARSLSKLLLSGAAVAALVSSCTIETKSGDSKGGSSSGTTGGSSATTGGSESTTGGTSANTGGSTGTTGGSSATTGGNTATTGGSSGAAGSGGDDTGGVGGAGGAGGMSGGAGGEGGASFDDCDTCLDAKCTKEFDACLEDEVCFTGDINNPGQYEQVIRCVDMIRLTRPVKRADLRDCGNSVGSSLGTLWPPEEMSVATVDLINCMATGVANESGNSAWANSSNIMNVWASGSCAKLACTAQLP